MSTDLRLTFRKWVSQWWLIWLTAFWLGYLSTKLFLKGYFGVH